MHEDHTKEVHRHDYLPDLPPTAFSVPMDTGTNQYRFFKHTERKGQKGGDYILHVVDEQHLNEWTELY